MIEDNKKPLHDRVFLCVGMTIVLLCIAFVINSTFSFLTLLVGLTVSSDLIYIIMLTFSVAVIPAINEESCKRVALLVDRKIMVWLFPISISCAEAFWVYSGESIYATISRFIFHFSTTMIQYLGLESNNTKFKRITFAIAILMHFALNLMGFISHLNS